MSTLKERIANLSPAKRALLEQHLQAQAAQQTRKQTIPSRDPSVPVPLSFAQERLWFLAQLEPGSAAYNSMHAIRMKGQLAVAALEQSLDAMAERHDMLRVCFRKTEQHSEPTEIVLDEQVVQVADPLPPIRLPIIDLTEFAGDRQTTAAWDAMNEMGNRIFAMTEPPLWRAALVRLAGEDHIFVFVIHHIITDGWSNGIFWRELRYFYSSFINGGFVNGSFVSGSFVSGSFVSGEAPEPLPNLRISYRDFAVWQREQLQGERLQKLVDYWRTHLVDVQPLNLPTDRPRPRHLSHRGQAERFELNTDLSQSLAAFARASGVSLYMLLLAAFQLLLHRYSGQDDIIVGTSTANRIHVELERLHGFFVNTLIMRADCSDNPPFHTFLERVRQDALAAYQHQELPFEKLVEELRPKRALNRNPLYDIAFTMQNMPRDTQYLAELNCERLYPTEVTNKFDLSLHLFEMDTQLFGRLEYSVELFDDTTIQRMIGHFQTLLAAIVANPACPIKELPLLTEAERQQLLVGWNDTTMAYPKEMCIHQLFEEQAERTPDAVAVVSGEQQMTYRDVNACANRLAHHLQELGVQPEVNVGLCVERPLEMVISLFAILKAGGAYVPLDPNAPRERIAFQLEDTQSPVIITQSHLLPNLPPQTAMQQVICLDKLAWSLLDVPTNEAMLTMLDNPMSETRSDNLAYILYTSGSTGRPKGVCVEHRQVVAYCHAVIERCQFEPGMRYAMVQPLTVDSSVTMLYPPLWTGGILYVADRLQALDPNTLATLLQRQAIDCLKIAPSHLLALRAAATDPSSLLPRKRLVVGGEASRWQWLQKLAQAGECLVYNHYGPTETTVGVTTYHVTPEGRASFENAPIGRPLANTQLYLLDATQQPVPIGCWGELYVGGDLVTRGYLNNPDLTKTHFVPDPFHAPAETDLEHIAPTRLYKTGDWARYLPDGTIEYFGRKDDQVKIHGFRIELGEIESVLGQHPLVQTAIVVAQADESDGENHRLVAYLVPSRKERPPTAVFRDYLAEKLPAYMIPTAFVMLDTLPLTTHGKVDRHALPKPDQLSSNGQASVAPRTATEQQLAELWSQLLGLAPVRLHDRFFALGGHSLKAIQLVSRLRQRFAIEVPVRVLFERETVYAQAQYIDALLTAQDAGTDGEIAPNTPLAEEELEEFAW